MQKRGGITTFRSNFFVLQYRKISLGNTSVCHKILGSEKFYASERGDIKFLGRKLFVTLPENFVREDFGVSENFVHRKNLCIRRGYH